MTMVGGIEYADERHPPRIIAFGLPYDGLVCFATRITRMFSYGIVTTVLMLFLIESGCSETEAGALLSVFLLGDVFISLFLSMKADRLGRRKMLFIGSVLHLLCGIAFASTSSLPLLAITGIFGILCASAGEIGPFIALEQAFLADSVLTSHTDHPADCGAITESQERPASLVQSQRRSVLYGCYNALGFVAQAMGALCGGAVVEELQVYWGYTALQSYRAIFVGYGFLGGLMALMYATLTRQCEPRQTQAHSQECNGPSFCSCKYTWRAFRSKDSPSAHIVAATSTMFALDSFAGTLIMQAWVAFWFDRVWHLSPGRIGVLLMACNALSGASSVASPHVAKRLGPVLTMLVTQLPSNALLLMIPLMQSVEMASVALIVRYALSHMDVPARNESMKVELDSDEASAVHSNEGSAVRRIVDVVQSVSMSVAPLLAGYLSSYPTTSVPFSSTWYIAGTLKIVFNILLFVLCMCGSTTHTQPKNAEGIIQGGCVISCNHVVQRKGDAVEKVEMGKDSGSHDTVVSGHDQEAPWQRMLQKGETVTAT